LTEGVHKCIILRMSEQLYTVTQFAKLLGVTVKTLQRWDREGTFKARRTPTNRRYYTHDDYLAYLKGEKKTDATLQENQVDRE
jgi:putative resolvase